MKTEEALKRRTKSVLSVPKDNLIREAFQVYAVQQDKFRDTLIALAEDGARIIVDDLDDSEPWFEDGKMAQAISYVKEK